MKYLVDSREMQKYDANTISHFKVPGLLLMERAAIAFVEELHRQNVDLTEVLIVCGSGNNGGDGLAIARLLFLEGHAVTVVYAGNKEHCSESNRVQQDILNAYGISIYMDIPEKIRPTLVIDAIFGVGLSRDVTGEYADMLCRMNELSGEKAAVDIASGISADTGAILGTAFRADLTITFAFEKLGSILWPGNEYAGRIIVCDIGITKESWLGEPPAVMALEEKGLHTNSEKSAIMRASDISSVKEYSVTYAGYSENDTYQKTFDDVLSREYKAGQGYEGAMAEFALYYDSEGEISFADIYKDDKLLHQFAIAESKKGKIIYYEASGNRKKVKYFNAKKKDTVEKQLLDNLSLYSEKIYTVNKYNK